VSLDREQRQIGNTGIYVSPVALGCWPLSGMTSLDVNESDSLATIVACFDNGINFLDTAYMYGAEGESEKLIAKAIEGRRDELVIATKGGLHWDSNMQRALDARPATLRRECEESLRRLNTDRVDLLYLHAPDPHTPLADSAGTLRELMDQGKARCVGVSNFSLDQLIEFQKVCPISAFQPPYNMLQREIQHDSLPWCIENNISVIVYWPLMKGLFAGKLSRDHIFVPEDGRAKYPVFQGEEWIKNQDLVDDLRTIATNAGKTVAQLVVNWTIHQRGITAALCGAKRAEQIQETAGAMGWRLTEEQLQQIDAALTSRGAASVQSAV